MKLEYDAEADALYVRVTEGVVARTVEAGARANLDFDADGVLLGVEVFQASLGVPRRVLQELAAG